MLKNLLNKISPVYALQVLAVVFLFSYAGVSSGKEKKEPLTNVTLPLVINKEKLFKSDKDSLINNMWKSYTDIIR